MVGGYIGNLKTPPNCQMMNGCLYRSGCFLGTTYAITSTHTVTQQTHTPLNQISLSPSSGPFHRDRRRYLRTALMELNQLLSDSPGLLGPKVSIYTNVSTCISRVNPLTTDDKCTRHATLAACYQLAHFVLKIGFALPMG